MIGQVVSMGPLCYTGERFKAADVWVQPGDYVMMGKYNGHRFKVDSEEYRIINDDEVIGVVPNPKAIRAA